MVMTREPTQAVTFGSVYSVLRKHYELDFVAVRTSMFNRANLNKFNFIIFPDRNPADYEEILGKSGVAKLKKLDRKWRNIYRFKRRSGFYDPKMLILPMLSW
ncbi:MAG: hypothetical protein M3405_05450 [Acidobacteriota bacterium]|jgi:hypothetical protein|nr:hypothetical protein [Acidobacteriota bacterium]